MFEKVIEKRTKRFLESLVQDRIIDDFYLVGGTALAFQLGHRKSIDLDWFSLKEINNSLLKQKISNLGKVQVVTEEQGTLDLVVNGIKLSFFLYPYNLLFPPIEWKNFQIADYRDIACMKLDAISSRGTKKDFIDLYFVLQRLPLSYLLELFEKKYQEIDFNKSHILKSLVYFKDAENDPMPVMFKKVEWEKIKSFFENKVKDYLQN